MPAILSGSVWLVLIEYHTCKRVAICSSLRDECSISTTGCADAGRHRPRLFSFPLRYFEVHGLLPDWPTLLDDFHIGRPGTTSTSFARATPDLAPPESTLA
jgi:hypothetical protein